MKLDKTLNFLSIVLLLAFSNLSSALGQGIIGEPGALPECTVESQNGYLPPRPPFFPIIQTTLRVGRATLWTLPFDTDQNPVLFPQIPERQLLGIIGRTESSFGDWLFVEVRLPETEFLYGFVRIQQTSYSGSLADLPIVVIEACEIRGSSFELPLRSPEPSRFITRQIDDLFYTSFPSDWIYYAAAEGGVINSNLYDYLSNLESPTGMVLDHRFIAAPATQDNLAEFGIFYLGAYQGDYIALRHDSEFDLLTLTEDLETALPSLEYEAQSSGQYQLVTGNIVQLNGYPFLFLHYSFPNALSQEQMQYYGISPVDNEIVMYVFLTYANNRWYQASIIGVRIADSLLQTILSSFYVI